MIQPPEVSGSLVPMKRIDEMGTDGLSSVAVYNFDPRTGFLQVYIP